MGESNVESLRKLRNKYYTYSGPLIRFPLTEILSINLHSQHENRCNNFELRLAECIEAYGFYKGIEKCGAVLNDFQECMTQEKRRSRYELICAEFIRQVEAGERNYEKVPFIAFF